MDELADRVRMDPVEFRMKNLPPRGAERDVGGVLRRSAPRRSAGTSGIRPAIRRPARSRRGMGCVGAPLGRRRPRHAGARATSCPTAASSMNCGTQDIGTGTRTIVAMVAAETLGLPIERGEGRDRRHATTRSAAGRAAARRRRRSRRRSASTAGKALDALFAKVAPTLGVEPGDARRRARPDSRRRATPSKGLAWKDACKLLGTEPISVDGEWERGPLGERHERRAVRRGRSRHRDRHRQGRRDPRACRTAG